VGFVNVGVFDWIELVESPFDNPDTPQCRVAFFIRDSIMHY